MATLGTAILESEFYNFFHPKTVAGMYRKELLLSGTVAFTLGALVYFKWKPKSAQWICVLGFMGFVWRILLGDQPPTFYAGAQWVTLVFVSLRVIAYSAGALCCSAVVKPAPLMAREDETLESLNRAALAGKPDSDEMN